MNEEIKIGSTVWQFDGNRRIYAKDGRGGPLRRGHWMERVITRETSRSWVVGEHAWDQRKIPKKGEHCGWCLSQKELDDDIWIHENRYQISQWLSVVKDADTLKQIASMIGYKEKAAQ